MYNLPKKQIFLHVQAKFSLYSLYLMALLLCVISCKKKDKLAVNYASSTIASDIQVNNSFWLSSSTGFVCGGERSHSGKIFKTTNGGATWNEVYSNTALSLYDVCFVNDSVGYCGGEKFTMLFTIDAGKTWQNYKFGWMPGNYQECTLRNLSKIGNRVLVTGGDNFNLGITFQFGHSDFGYRYSHPDSELRGSLSFDNGNSYYFFGYGYGFRSNDSMKTYEPINLTNDFFTGSTAINNSLAYVCGYNGGIYKTKNAGQNWEKIDNVNHLLTARDHFNSILFTDEQNGWCVGNNGLILNTVNGSDWKKVDYSGKENFLSVRQKSGSIVIVSTSDGKLLEFN